MSISSAYGRNEPPSSHSMGNALQFAPHTHPIDSGEEGRGPRPIGLTLWISHKRVGLYPLSYRTVNVSCRRFSVAHIKFILRLVVSKSQRTIDSLYSGVFVSKAHGQADTPCNKEDFLKSISPPSFLPVFT